jgi:hypothetical protein
MDTTHLTRPPRVRIESNGEHRGTRIYIDDTEVTNDVVAVTWTAQAGSRPPTATITFIQATVEAAGGLTTPPDLDEYALYGSDTVDARVEHTVFGCGWCKSFDDQPVTELLAAIRAHHAEAHAGPPATDAYGRAARPPLLVRKQPAFTTDGITVTFSDGRTIPYEDCDFSAEQDAGIRGLLDDYDTIADFMVPESLRKAIIGSALDRPRKVLARDRVEPMGSPYAPVTLDPDAMEKLATIIEPEHNITVMKSHPVVGNYWQAMCSCGGGVTLLYATPEAAEEAARDHEPGKRANDWNAVDTPETRAAAHGVLVAQESDVATRLMHELGTTKHSKPPL